MKERIMDATEALEENDTGQETEASGADDTAQAPQQPDVVQARVGGGKNVVLPQTALNRMLKEERERSRRQASKDLETRASSAGFASLDAMFAQMGEIARLSKSKGQGSGNGGQQQQRQAQPQQERQAEQLHTEQETAPADRPQPPRNRQDRKAMERYDREMERWRTRYDAVAKKARTEEKRRRDLQRVVNEKDAEKDLALKAVMHGVKDIDYALHLLQRKLRDMDEKELSSFDEDKYFSEDLRQDKPYLYGEVVKPATTGIGAANPPAREPGQVAQKAAKNGQADARNMSREEFSQRLASMGLQTPTL